MPVFILACIIGLGLWLRLSGLDYGLPLFMQEDESIYFHKAMQFGYGDFNPDYFKKPSFFLYFYFAFYYLFNLLNGALAWADFETLFWQDPSQVVFLGRAVTLCFAMGSVGLTYLIGKRVFSTFVGLAAAFLLAIHTTHVSYSPIVISDIPSVFFILLSTLCALNVYHHGRLKDYLLCGLSLALVFSFKYNVFASVVLIAAHSLHYFGESKQTLKGKCFALLKNNRLWLGLGVSVIVFLLLSPYTLINFARFQEHLSLEKQHMLQRTVSANTSSLFTPFVSFPVLFLKLIPRNLSWGIFILGLLGMVIGLVGTRRRTTNNTSYNGTADYLILLSFPFLFFIVICQFKLLNSKYILPLVPYFMICASAGLYWCCEKLCTLTPLKSSSSLSKITIAITALLMILISQPLWSDSIKQQARYVNQPTPSLVLSYLQKNVQPNQRLLFEKKTFPSRSIKAVDAVFKTQLVAQMGLPETSADTVLCTQPNWVVINPTEKRWHGYKGLPYENDAYYNYLRQHFTPVAGVSEAGTIVFHAKTEDKLKQAINDGDYLTLYHILDKRKPKKHSGPTLLILKQKSKKTL